MHGFTICSGKTTWVVPSPGIKEQKQCSWVSEIFLIQVKPDESVSVASTSLALLLGFLPKGVEVEAMRSG
jgi:hypothetical protein